mgnify:CR=1 FL=1
MSKQKKELVDKLCETVITAHQEPEWEEAAASCVRDLEKIAALDALPEVTQVAGEHDLGFYPAALLYHSTKHKKEKEE